MKYVQKFKEILSEGGFSPPNSKQRSYPQEVFGLRHGINVIIIMPTI